MLASWTRSSCRSPRGKWRPCSAEGPYSASQTAGGPTGMTRSSRNTQRCPCPHRPGGPPARSLSLRNAARPGSHTRPWCGAEQETPSTTSPAPPRWTTRPSASAAATASGTATGITAARGPRRSATTWGASSGSPSARTSGGCLRRRPCPQRGCPRTMSSCRRRHQPRRRPRWRRKGTWRSRLAPPWRRVLRPYPCRPWRASRWATACCCRAATRRRRSASRAWPGRGGRRAAGALRSSWCPPRSTRTLPAPR
mmetsp:Transcript_18136/g.47830  ORF Transcript_18136/g.47830 Transcript_18136/m.47830 type:complete len:253 (+) Transcript_18136:171-929(+)